jgi:signal transduction histidine kinase
MVGASANAMPDAPHIDDAMLREVLHALSHDVRNPLAAIVTNLEFARRLCERTRVDPDVSEAVHDSMTACDVLRRIIANLDVLVKGSELVASMHEIDLATVVEDVARRCRARAEQAGVVVVTSLPASRRRVLVDRMLLGLALENLLENSLQYAPRGSEVRMELATAAEEARLQVRDSGGAIPSELRELATSASAHTTKGRRMEARYGRGLGLLSAKAAATAAGARLELGGEGEASLMTLILPLPAD